MTDLIKPKEVEIKDVDGNTKTFTISRLPAIAAREVLAKYPVANIPKLGEYQASAESMRLLMSFVAVKIEGRDDLQKLTSATLINNHVADGEQLLRLEFAMLEYNTSFFGKGNTSGFLAGLIKTHLPLIIQTVTDSLPPSLVRDLRAGLNLKP